MEKLTDTNKATHHIMNWSDRPEWAAGKKTIFESHLDTICDFIGINHQELTQELEDHGFDGMLFAVIFEDFLSHHSPTDNRNIIDDYLTRRGWNETALGQLYLEQLRDSVLSLYEVVEVSPGRHCDLRDLLRGGKTIRVNEVMGTQNIVKWDRIAARVLNMNNEHIFSGGILPFDQEAALRLIDQLTEIRNQLYNKGLRKPRKNPAANRFANEIFQDLFLRDVSALFTSIWLDHALDSIYELPPQLTNSDGEALVFTETSFTLQTAHFNTIKERLNAAPEWEYEPLDELTWIWLLGPDASNVKPSQTLDPKALADSQQLIGGTVKLTSTKLTLSTNSFERTNQAKALLEACLQNLIGPALSKLQTAEQLLSENEDRNRDENYGESETIIDPEVEVEIVHEFLDQHYRQILDEPIPALGNKSPLQSVRNKKGREKVIEWLKQLENTEQRRAAISNQKPYNSKWMWDELNLTD